MTERYIIEQTSRRDEYEYAVVDTQTGRIVALFLVNRSQWGESYHAAKRKAHLRARRVQVGLNKKERERLLAAVPAADDVALVGGEAGERLVLDDLAGAGSGNDLAVPDVHDDVAATA